MEAIPATFCSGRGVYSWRTFSHRKILLFHHPALLFLTVASFLPATIEFVDFWPPLILPVAILTLRLTLRF